MKPMNARRHPQREKHGWQAGIGVLAFALLLTLLRPVQARLPEHGKQYLRNLAPVHFAWVALPTVNFAQFKAANLTGLQRALFTQTDIAMLNAAGAAEHQLIKIPYIFAVGVSQAVMDRIAGVSQPDDTTRGSTRAGCLCPERCVWHLCVLVW